MKEILKNYKWHIIFSSLATLLPTVFGLIMWDELPEKIAIHWGFAGKADGFSSLLFFVVGLPVILLVIYWGCLFFTALDQKGRGQNKKAMRMIFWIIPAISVYVSSMMYATVLGAKINVYTITVLFFGILFVIIGNYMPKVKQNRTLGIKISWTLKSEENWNATHRFAGKVWFLGGIIMFLLAVLFMFVPAEIFVWTLIPVVVVLVFAPMIYSYVYYKKQLKEGRVDKNAKVDSAMPKAAKISTAVALPIILVAVGVLMFTGNVEASLDDDSLNISTTYWSDADIKYEDIDSLEYREDGVSGARVNGYASARLLLGMFNNEELGGYTRYTYTGGGACIILRSGESVLVLGLEDNADTKALYEALLEKISD